MQYICKYRLSAHQLELERGRFFNIDRSERICKHCSLGNVEDEFHFILICPFMQELEKNILNNIITKNLLHWNLFNYSLQKMSQNYVDLGNILINVQSLERKTHSTVIIIIIIIFIIIHKYILICCFNMKIWFVEICYKDTIPHWYYLIDIFMIFDLYYISCTQVKPMNCMALGNKQYKQNLKILMDYLSWRYFHDSS